MPCDQEFQNLCVRCRTRREIGIKDVIKRLKENILYFLLIFAQPMYESWFIALYTIMYTSLPVQCLGIFDQVSKIAYQTKELIRWEIYSRYFYTSLQMCPGTGHERRELSSLAGGLLSWTETGVFQPSDSVCYASLFHLHLHHPLLHPHGSPPGHRCGLSDVNCYCGNVSCVHSYSWGTFTYGPV